MNVFGLTIGIACAALIFLWVEDEVNYDTFHAKKDRIYFVKENQKYDTYTATFGSTPGVMAPAIQAEIPGIAATCRVTESDAPKLFTIGDKAVYADGRYAESSLFNMFTFPFAQGNAKTAFAQLHSLVITEKTAKKFFGTETNVVGKTVRVDNKQDYVVTGVLKDIPEHSSLQFEWVAPFQVWYDQSSWAHSWGNNCLSTYVELKPGITAASVDKLLFNFIQQREPKSNARPFLFPMKDWRLRGKFEDGKQTGGRIEYVRLFSLIAWIILFIACINFMNLATARSERRAREVGVRKVLGAEKRSLIAQFIGESMLVAAVAAIFAVMVVSLLLPAFNTLVEKQLSLGLTQPLHLGALLAITLVCGLIAGSYPSLYLSSFNPVAVLKSLRVKSGGVAFVRKGLVVLQFSVSVVLIISTIVVYRQIQHVKNRNLGFAKNNLLEADLQGEVGNYFAAMKQDLLNTGVVESAAGSDHTILYDGNNTGSLTWQGKASDMQVLISGRYVTPEFMPTIGMKLLSGRNFVPADSINSKQVNVIVTQSLEKLIGNGSVVGKTLWNAGDTSGTKLTVIGVCNDYVYGNMYGKPDPVVFLCTPPEHINKLYLRLRPQAGVEKALAAVETVMKRSNPAYPFNYVFVDDQFNRMFLNEMLIGKLARLFAALAILISCLGLFGLAAYTAERRTKEIGIRKVLGANVRGLALLLSKDFLQLVIVSCVVAFPVAWWLMNNWLQDYKYRIVIGWWVFLLAGLMAVFIALITVSFQAIKAAVANPVKSLRTE